MTVSTYPSLPFLARRRTVLMLILLVIFGLGLAVRLYDLTDLPLDFHATRQLHSAIMARGMYYQHLTDAPQWQRELAIQMWKAEGLIEPPFMEWLTASTYRLLGNEVLWVARIYSILFWMLGGVGLFLLARQISGLDGAVISVLYALLLPYGIIASRAFQPDPLMTALIVFAWWGMVRWHSTPTRRWTVIAGLLSGLAILCKATALFFIAPAWAGLVLAARGLRGAVRDKQVWLLAGLTVLPFALYHVYGVYISGVLESQFSYRFFPNLWLDPVFYLRWKGMIASTLVFEWFLVAFLASFTIRQPAHRALVLGVWTGYFMYGLTFAYHVSTHDYYQLPMVPLVALGLGAAAQLVFENLKGRRALLYPLVAAALLAVAVVNAWDARVALKREDWRGEAQFWAELGEKLGRESRVVGITEDYGYRLAYFGWKPTTNWLSSGDITVRELSGVEIDTEKLFREQTAGMDFFVVTRFKEYDSQPKLKSLLENHYPVYDKSGDYIIFDLRQPKEGAQSAP